MLTKWLVLFLGFLFCFLTLEVYRNTALMERGYLLQKLKVRKSRLIEEQGYLQETLSSHLSLNRLDSYARKELGFMEPQNVRFLREHFSPPKRSSSPPPFTVRVRAGVQHLLLNIKKRVGALLGPLFSKTSS